MSHAETHLPARVWRDHPRETLALGLLAFVTSAAFASASFNVPRNAGSGAEDRVAEAPPAPPPLLVRQMAPEVALNLNDRIPVASGPNPAAAPFRLAAASVLSRQRALECLTSAIYYEAGNESADGQRAVAQVVLNRVRHPAFPANVCSVVYQGSTRATGCQFTFTCDGSLLRQPSTDRWTRARGIAQEALAGVVYAPVGYATHYHANYVVPYWAASLAKNAVVGAHIFYRWAGGWGRPGAFGKRYAAVEPDTAALKSAALAAEAAQPVASSAVETARALDEIPGAEAKKAEQGRVAIRFTLARKAVEEAPRAEYVDKFKASDNLRWSLSGDSVKASEQPLGKAPSEDPPTGAASAGAGAP